MPDFDPLKAQRDIVNGALDVHRTVQRHARDLQRQLGEIEALHNAALKVEALARADLDIKQVKLQQLVDEAMRKQTV